MKRLLIPLLVAAFLVALPTLPARAAHSPKITWLDSGIIPYGNINERISFEQRDDINLFPAHNASDKYGYIDETGQIVIPFNYDYAASFAEGLAVVGMKDADGEPLFGYIDPSGREIIPLQFQEASSFSDGRALVYKRGSGSYYINQAGVQAIQESFYSYDTEPFSDGVARVNDKLGYTRYIDTNGQTLAKADGYGGHFAVGRLSEGLFAVNYYTDYKPAAGSGRSGYMDAHGDNKWAIAPNYTEVSDFSDGLGRVAVGGLSWDKDSGWSFNRKEVKYGFIDKNGETVILPKYDTALSFSEGLAAVGYRLEDDTFQVGYIDTSGTEVIPMEYADGYAPSNGLIAVAKLVNGALRYGYLDCRGNEVTPCKYNRIWDFPSTNLWWAGEEINGNQKYRMIDRFGNEITEAIYSKVGVLGNGQRYFYVTEGDLDNIETCRFGILEDPTYASEPDPLPEPDTEPDPVPAAPSKAPGNSDADSNADVKDSTSAKKPPIAAAVAITFTGTAAVSAIIIALLKKRKL